MELRGTPGHYDLLGAIEALSQPLSYSPRAGRLKSVPRGHRSLSDGGEPQMETLGRWSDLADAIRDHLELKRQRGADPAEVAREEHEALAPVTRSHTVVATPVEAENDEDEPEAVEADVPAESGGSNHGEAEAEIDADATQEFRVEHDGDWLEAGD